MHDAAGFHGSLTSWEIARGTCSISERWVMGLDGVEPVAGQVKTIHSPCNSRLLSQCHTRHHLVKLVRYHAPEDEEILYFLTEISQSCVIITIYKRLIGLLRGKAKAKIVGQKVLTDAQGNSLVSPRGGCWQQQY